MNKNRPLSEQTVLYKNQLQSAVYPTMSARMDDFTQLVDFPSPSNSRYYLYADSEHHLDQHTSQSQSPANTPVSLPNLCALCILEHNKIIPLTSSRSTCPTYPISATLAHIQVRRGTRTMRKHHRPAAKAQSPPRRESGRTGTRMLHPQFFQYVYDSQSLSSATKSTRL